MLNEQEKNLLREIMQYIFDSEETHYEETIDTCGHDSAAVKEHIYEKARIAYAVFELDYSSKQ